MPELKTIQFRPGPLSEPLQERASGDKSPHYVAQRDLEVYYNLLMLGLASVDLSEGEALFLVDILNGTVLELMTARMLPYEIEDAEPEYLAKWEIDRAVLLAKVGGWTLLQRMAVIDAVERAWGNTYHVDDMRARVARVGLVKQSV